MVGDDAVIIKGGLMKVNYSFNWEKKQLDTILVKGKGKGKFNIIIGSATTDSI